MLQSVSAAENELAERAGVDLSGASFLHALDAALGQVCGKTIREMYGPECDGGLPSGVIAGDGDIRAAFSQSSRQPDADVVRQVRNIARG